ncbi:MAG: AraC family transcriptional regulator [Lachnospiraceae bacterium]|nr:AraC family transcriptional regulator [Lachnospiraceae bacterium]
MNWVIGIQKAIDYIEEHLTENIDYEMVAAQSFSSAYHFQRVFSILCGFTLGEYIRNRRLSLAGTELATTDIKIVDVALKYGYESPDSFAKAFQKFHGVLPSQARNCGCNLKSFSRLVLKISLEGGNIMNYRIEEKPEMILTGYKRRFVGTPADRIVQEHDFYVSTRVSQYLLKGISRDCDTQYNVMCDFDDEGYNFYIASKLDEWQTDHVDNILGHAEEARSFEKIVVPAGLYLVCETERMKYPTVAIEELRRKAVSEWLPSSGYEIADAAEISVIHWFYKRGDEELNNSRYIELWLPITKCQ